MSLLKILRSLSLPALVALLVGLSFTLLLFAYTQRNTTQEEQRNFSHRAELAKSALRRVNEDVFNKLLAIRSLTQSGSLDASNIKRDISPKAHRHFASGLQFVGLMRAKTTPDSRCDPLDGASRCLQTSVIYPLATNEAIVEKGLSDSASRDEAMRRAIDTGYFAITAPLAYAIDNVAEPGVLAFLPVYAANAPLDSIQSRRSALIGLAVASYSLEFMLRIELGRQFFDQTALRIDDLGLTRNQESSVDAINPASVMNSLALMRGRAPVKALDAPFTHTNEQIGGRLWSLRFSDIGLSEHQPTLAPKWIVLLLGSLLSLLLATFIQKNVGARDRAEAIAQDRDAKLSQALKAARMGGWQWHATNGEFWHDRFAATLLQPTGNGGIERLFESFDPKDRPSAIRALGLAVAEKRPMHFEARLTQRKHNVHWVAVTAQLTQDADNNILSATGLIRDITDRVELTTARQQLVSKLVNAEEQVRHDIARELHDQLGQEITALILGLKNLEDLPADSSAYQSLFDKLRQIMHDIDSRVDKYMLDLRPVVLDDLGLSAALRSQCLQWTDLHHIPVHAHLENLDQHSLPFEVATTAFRVVQESLTNVAKHSNATVVDVIAEVKAHELRIVVEDNGDGANEERSLHSYGLVGIRERVESLGGQCRYESSTGNGFSVFVKLPVNELTTPPFDPVTERVE